MRIYHGSPEVVQKPDLAKGKPHNDYGRGFYCTRVRELACEWACRDPRESGFANAYELDEAGLRIVNLDDDPNGVLGWAATLMRNRPVNYVAGTDRERIALFIERYAVDFSQVDVVEGWRADDSYFDIMRAFASNSITAEHLESALRMGDLGRQVVLKSPRAFEALTFVEAERVDKAKWHPLREGRNTKARAEFQRSRETGCDGTFLVDILRRL